MPRHAHASRYARRSRRPLRRPFRRRFHRPNFDVAWLRYELPPPCPPSVRHLAGSAMDSDDEQTLAVLLEEENADAAEDAEHIEILASLTQLYLQMAKPKRRASAPGRRKC